MTASDLLVVVGALAVGVGAGMLSALMGIGGAVVSTPAVRVLGATPIEAVGSTVPAILPGAISGSVRYARAGLVDWRVALGAGVSGAVFALVGALTSSAVDGRLLMVATAALMLWSGISVLRGRSASEVADPDRSSGTSLWQLGLVGAVAGFVAGLLGVGGGIVMVPAMTGPLGLPMRKAVASSLVAVAIFSVPALITHAALGHINWLYALPLMVGVVPGAQLGSRVTIGATDRTMRAVFGVFVAVLAVIFGVSELAALVR